MTFLWHESCLFVSRLRRKLRREFGHQSVCRSSFHSLMCWGRLSHHHWKSKEILGVLSLTLLLTQDFRTRDSCRDCLFERPLLCDTLSWMVLHLREQQRKSIDQWFQNEINERTAQNERDNSSEEHSFRNEMTFLRNKKKRGHLPTFEFSILCVCLRIEFSLSLSALKTKQEVYCTTAMLS